MGTSYHKLCLHGITVVQRTGMVWNMDHTTLHVAQNNVSKRNFTHLHLSKVLIEGKNSLKHSRNRWALNSIFHDISGLPHSS